MKTTTNIRAARPEDARTIYNIYLTSRKQLLPYAPLVHSDTEIYDWICHTLIPSHQTIVAEEQGHIIGMMVLAHKDKIGWIEQLYLLPELTGQGIGSMLINVAKSNLGSPIRLRCFQENVSARHFYEHHGFRVIAFGNGSDNEEYCPDVIYEWLL